MGKLKNIALVALFALASAGGTEEYFRHTGNRYDIQAQVQQAAPGSGAQKNLIHDREIQRGEATLGLLSVFGALALVTGSLRRKAAPAPGPS